MIEEKITCGGCGEDAEEVSIAHGCEDCGEDVCQNCFIFEENICTNCEK